MIRVFVLIGCSIISNLFAQGSIVGNDYCSDSHVESNYADSLREITSFCAVIPIEKQVALSALQNLKIFFNIEEYLNFEKLKGGAYNAPILVFKFAGQHKIPLGVLKQEEDSLLAMKRMQALDEMIKSGFEHFPRILRSKSGEYIINLGRKFYSCIEYLKPDAHQPVTFEQMLKLTSIFHAYSKKIHLTEVHFKRTLDWFANSSSSILNLNPKLTQWDPSIFKTAAWEQCVKCSDYFISPSFRKIYNRLPAQLIHGDISPSNIVFSGGKPFLIDLESVRTDVRLRDFAVFCRGIFLEQYLTLLEENKLFSFIQTHYGELENEEKEYFSIIILLERCSALAWQLQVLEQSLANQDLQKVQEFRNFIINTMKDISEMCIRIPLIKEIITR